MPGDDLADTAFFVARIPDQRVVGTATVRRDPPPWADPEPGAWRLRGMAVAADVRGLGIGRQLLDQAISYVKGSGGKVLWANARTPALGFYLATGFVAVTEHWVDEVTGPHVGILMELG